jgi:hypothetical protein
MDPISSSVALSLALGAAAIAGKEIVSSMVKDAYGVLKNLIKERFPKVSIAQLEQAPWSEQHRTVVGEALSASGAANDRELTAEARRLLDAVERHAPAAAFAIGVDLKDVRATNLRLADITATGTGVRVEHGTFSGDIDVRGVRDRGTRRYEGQAAAELCR